MPPAPEIFSRIQRVLDPAGFPNVFAQFEPPAASPLPTPTSPAIRAAAERARASTVKILDTACGELIDQPWSVAPVRGPAGDERRGSATGVRLRGDEDIGADPVDYRRAGTKSHQPFLGRAAVHPAPDQVDDVGASDAR